jgi:A/G-specific adenine glycosylase
LSPGFSERVLAWYDQLGRKDLPWQREVTGYRVWVSEIMLQQTQVATVTPYFDRFMARFPDLQALAEAPLDEVLHHWSGLGYYARARNLHRAARLICEVGRSTAGAILTLACGQRHPILDGNVKRVLARVFAVEGWRGDAAVLKRLWVLAESLVPEQRAASYTQGLMDLGALVCARTRPACEACPLACCCRARASGRTRELPASRPARPQPLRTVQLLILDDGDGRILLERRPPVGIWGGLWSFPECPAEEDARDWTRRSLGLDADLVEIRPARRHTFTHFRLNMIPVRLRMTGRPQRLADPGARRWYDPRAPESLGLAAPVAALIAETAENPERSSR